jgi:thiamine transport system ATP-binding protein
VTARYGATDLFTDLNLSVRHGEIVSLVGPSGTGKSTLLRIIAGLEPPVTGMVLLDDDDITTWPAHRRRIGLVFQDGALFPHLSVADNIGYGLKMQGIKREPRSRQVDELLGLIRLEGFGDRDVATLSGGEQQRVSLARALAPRPRVLLLDEPFASLDTDLREHLAREVRDILRARDTTAIIVTHDPHEAALFGDRTVRLADL